MDGVGSAQGWVYSASSQACRRNSSNDRYDNLRQDIEDLDHDHPA